MTELIITENKNRVKLKGLKKGDWFMADVSDSADDYHIVIDVDDNDGYQVFRVSQSHVYTLSKETRVTKIIRAEIIVTI